MSDTPKTDAQMWINRYPEYHATATRYVSANFARELERENAALREALQSIRYRMPSDQFIEDHDAVAVSTFKQIKKILNTVQKEAQP